ncbi:hypothetical protein OA04_28010 [Pectobacterium versatile]|nr:hypothetical protein OA04_28010 [Pectobacterium versatile]
MSVPRFLIENNGSNQNNIKLAISKAYHLCKDAGLQGCRVAGLQGCRVAGLQGCSESHCCFLQKEHFLTLILQHFSASKR